MFSFCSCRHTSLLVSLSLNVATKLTSRSPVSISSKHFFNSTTLNPSARTMSGSSRSAFDVLMANASKKKNQPSKAKESSPRKRKSPSKPQSQTPDLLPQKEDTPAPTENQDVVQNSRSCEIGGLKDSGSNQIQTSSNADKGLVVAKKPKLSITPEESVSELKKKAVEFKAKKAAYWGEGKRVPFMFLAKTLEAVSKESGRIVITGIVCNMLRTVMETAPDDLLAVMYLLVNRIAPAHEGLELGIGESSIIKALAEACGAKEAHIKKQYEELGDLGLVAKAIRTSQPLLRKPEPLTVVKVFDTFRLIAKESGKDSQEKKKNLIKALLVATTDCEPQFLIRLLQTKLRIGLAEQTLLAALGHAAVYSEKHSVSAKADHSLEEAAKIIKQVYSVIPVYDKIIPALLCGGVWDLHKTCSFSPGIPVGPMLAKPTKGVSEIVEKFQGMEYTCEYKYDGERAQIHYMENGSVEIYSRNAERNTGKFPDVVAAITRLKKPSVKSFVLDCELVAYDREKQKILPFQILSTRARKNVVMNEIKVNVCIYAFDILYLDGQLLLQEQLNVRREHLYKSFQEEPGFFQFATAITSDDLEEIQKFLDDAVNSSSEGLIIKTLKKDATYEPSKRSLNWLKLKKDYMDTIGDSLDLVPIAAFHGRGKRTGVYGAFLLACYDNDKEEFQSICKIGTGFSEAMLEERSSSLRSKVIEKPKSYYRYGDTLSPDVWFEPSEVWEVKAADLTISPVHRAAVGTVDPDKGISLRFPRLLRVREDKNPEQASSSDMVADMYNAQKHTQKDNQYENDDV
ncbi:DNA ligase 1-like [Salvia splendens]|uniref:DNA ligase 1-like n=1 Tax=Salvia splendens TaxID=180675 RepID=UPI001C27574B|nr:DNA ligase 1-like [Salvia splendens]